MSLYSYVGKQCSYCVVFIADCVAPSAPLDLKVQVQGSGFDTYEALLRWKRPSLPNGQLQFYVVRYLVEKTSRI